ncbi:MAG: hypothetical protein EP344_19195 [Bacteroidetes bacterium]|nr:MAG: hypothetical protein EP344_19195 [Bacteroidota bacterium]
MAFRIKRKTLFRWFVIDPVIWFLVMEVLLRILGFEPFYNTDYSIQATPPNAFVGHPQLGIQLNPGNYRITVNDSLTFTAQHLANHTRLVPGRTRDSLDVLLLGCSFTYGFGVNDDQTFAALLQQDFPGLGIQNAGVVGYGSVQALLELWEYLDTCRPKVVLLHFSSLHFMRNTMSPQYRSNLRIGYDRSSRHVDNLMQQARFPYMSECNGPVEYMSWTSPGASMYANWPGREGLALINLFQTVYDRHAENVDKQVKVTACILRDMQALCREKVVAFGVVCLDTTLETIALRKQLNGIPWVDIGFPFSSRQLTNLPYDSHPSASGHQLIARKVKPFLETLLE